MSKTVRLIVRGFRGHDRIFESGGMEMPVDELKRLLPGLAEAHAADMINGTLTMIEIEFPDDPPEERFFRIGVDPSGMVKPMEIKL